MNILLPGQYPRSERLVVATRDFDRHRSSEADLKRIQHDDVQQFRELQKDWPYISSGFFHWQDLMRPFSAIVDEIQVGTLLRFYETNTFWRRLDFGAHPKVHVQQLDAWIEEYFLAEGMYSQADPMVLTLPFLYLFRDFSQGIALELVAELLAQIVMKLLSMPNKMLCFFEPTFGWRKLTAEEKAIGRTFIMRLKEHTKQPICLWSCFFCVEHELDFIYALPFDGFGFDFYRNSLSKCMDKFPKDKLLLAGIINTESSLIEPKKNVAAFFQMLHTYLPETQVYITPNGPAELLTREVMDHKVRNMQEII